VNLDLFGVARGTVGLPALASLGDGAAIGIRVEQFVEHLETREELPTSSRVSTRPRSRGVLRIIVRAERYLPGVLPR